jgi:phenylacetate-coenzyme A ligase PaaK-like adenylate-forming protein
MSRRGRIREFGRALRATRAAAERERWPEERMRAHQERAFAALLQHATARSPLYRERLRGVTALADAPPLDKATLMANLEDALTVPALRRRDLRAQVGTPGLLDGEYRVMASSGSTGTPSLYVYDRADWTGILAQFLRYTALAGIAPRLPRLRIAAIGAPSLASMTQRVAESSAVGVHRVLRLAVSDPLPRLAEQLDAFRPDVIAGYPSVVAALAREQLAGRLRIAPRIVTTSSELRTPDMTERIRRAFGVDPFDLYGTSEGLWGAECEHHAGPHLFEDWCIVENVDAQGRPVPDGDPGARLLVTNLHNRTLPLIRFEVSDVVVLDRAPCACGRTLPRLRDVHGRLDDVLELPGRDGRPVPVHPAQFSVVPADPAVRGFQVHGRSDGVLVRLVLDADDAAGSAAQERIARAVAQALEAAGVRDPVVRTERVAAIERTAAGKLRLVVPGTPRAPTLA